MQTRTCSQGASVRRTDDSQMFLSRHYDSRDHVCLWGQPLKLHCLELDLWFHSHDSDIHRHTWACAERLKGVKALIYVALNGY